jgi:hypothetical protein
MLADDDVSTAASQTVGSDGRTAAEKMPAVKDLRTMIAEVPAVESLYGGESYDALLAYDQIRQHSGLTLAESERCA